MKKSLGLILICLTLQADVLHSILDSKKLRVCIWPEYYSISYIDIRTQTLKGLDVDLAYEFAKELGVQVDFIKSSFAKLVEDINTRKCDIAMFAIGQTAKRKEVLALTPPHLSSDIYAIASKGNNRINRWEDIDQDGVIVAVAKGTYHVDVMRKNLKKATLLVLDSMHAREQEVEAGRADAFMTDYPFGMRMLDQYDWPKMIKPPKPFHMTPYGWAMAKGEDKFLKKTQEFIEKIKSDGRLLQFAKKYKLESIVVD